MSRVDRALTVPGYVDESGRLAEITVTTYQRWVARLELFCRSRGLSHLPCTSETLAVWAEHLVAVRGYAVATAEEALVAVRWCHRLHGHPPPDRVAAWSVLRDLDPTRLAGSARPLVRPACRDDLIIATAVVGLDTPVGLRDALLLLMPYAYGMSENDVAVADVDDVDTYEPLCALWHTRHAMICPTCVLRRWRAVLAEHDIFSGPLLRPVDQHRRPAGAVGYCGGGVRSGGRIRPPRIRELARDVAARADLGDSVRRRPVLSARIGGAKEAAGRGADLTELSRRMGYATTSVMFGRYLASFLRDAAGE